LVAHLIRGASRSTNGSYSLGFDSAQGMAGIYDWFSERGADLDRLRDSPQPIEVGS
jgi:hypothetical protein